MANFEEKTCQNCNRFFAIDASDFDFYNKIKVPPPTFCPDCRLQRRLCFRNERSLYKRQCDLCSKDNVSMFHKNAPFPVYCHDCWWSDKWDPLERGRDYDFSQPFFKQLSNFVKIIP